jgi:hypothetical protein
MYDIKTSLIFAVGVGAAGISITPHDSYSSSVGVLGCKVNTNRIAYWPGSVDCNKICVRLSYSGRSVYLLRVDQSGGAYDVSYDAWNYLQTGKSATEDPVTGGGFTVDYEEVDALACSSLIYTAGSKLPLSAANSMGFLSSCLSQSSSWVANNYILYNICNPTCSLGFDEVCTLDLATSNQPSCAHTLGLTSTLTTAPVYNILYQSGKTVDARTGEVVTAQPVTGNTGGNSASSAVAASSSSTTSTVVGGVFYNSGDSGDSSSSNTALSTATLKADTSSSSSSTSSVDSTQTVNSDTQVSTPSSTLTVSNNQTAIAASATRSATGYTTVNASSKSVTGAFYVALTSCFVACLVFLGI